MILQRYIFKELLVVFVIAFAVLITVCTVGLVFNMFRATEGVTLSFIFEALPVAFSYMSPWALLVAATLTSTMVYGRLASDNEIDAMRSSGIHMGRIVAPALLFGIVVLVCSFLTHNELTPWAHYARRSLAEETILTLLHNPPPGRQVSIKIGKRASLSYEDARDGLLIKPFVSLFNEQGLLEKEFWGSEGRIAILSDREIQITIRDANLQLWTLDEKGELRQGGGGSLGKETQIPVQLEDPTERPKTADDMGGLELVGAWARSEGGRRKGFYTELHLRFAQSIGPVCLIFLGVPIGITVRKGTKLSGLGQAIPPLLGYFALLFVGQSLANRNLVAPEVGAYGPDAVVLVAAAVLWFRVFRT
jgi:lipopolysaccharide export system permease protein